MALPPQFGHREREILTAIVETYISTGEPVGSRTLARSSRESLSPATIRNVMADLVDAGFLEQPHTSAGRVPTAEAYRFYVDQLTGTAQLSAESEGMIQRWFQGVNDVQEFLERTSHVLSLVSSGVGVAVASGGPRNALDHIYFSRLAESKILAVVVTKAGIVRDRLLRVEHDLAQEDLDVAARFINDNFRGWTMDALRAEIERQLEQQRSEYDRLMRSVEELYRKGALQTDSTERLVFMEGTSNLVGDDEDKEKLRQLLRALEEKERIAEVLSAYVDVRQEAVRVVIGLDQAPPDLQKFVLIGAPARVGNEVMGALAVLGPTRIDYEHTITAVSYIAKLFDKILNESDKQ